VRFEYRLQALTQRKGRVGEHGHSSAAVDLAQGLHSQASKINLYEIMSHFLATFSDPTYNIYSCLGGTVCLTSTEAGFFGLTLILFSLRTCVYIS
jgi:hypothetical protein